MNGGLIAVCLILVIFCLAMIYFSCQGEISAMELEVRKLRTEEKILTEFAERQKKFPTLTGAAEENLISARKFLPSDLEQEIFTEELYRAAEKNNIAITSMQAGEVSQVEEKNFYRQSIKIQFESDYISMLNFLREISDGKRFVTQENISIDGAEEKLSCTAEFFIYAATD